MTNFLFQFARIEELTTFKIIKSVQARQNQQNDLCAQRTLRSARASAQSDLGLPCALSG